MSADAVDIRVSFGALSVSSRAAEQTGFGVCVRMADSAGSRDIPHTTLGPSYTY